MTRKLAEQLWNVRLNRSSLAISDISEVGTVNDAYQVQRQQIRISNNAVVGWKLGATNAMSLKAAGFDEPFIGPIFESFVFGSGNHCSIVPSHWPHLETEIAVTLDADLPGDQAPYGRVDIEAVIASISPSFEIVACRLENGFKDAGPLLIADGGANAAIVVGKPKADWRYFDLSDHNVEVTINGAIVASGSTEVLLWPDIIDAVVWLANHPELADRGLKAGDVIMTGTIAGLLPIKPGDTASADFGDLGAVSVKFSDGSK